MKKQSVLSRVNTPDSLISQEAVHSAIESLKGASCLIVANGCFLPSEIIKECASNRTIIALDGAVAKLEKIGLSAAFILGDFDSVSQEKREQWGIKKAFEELKEDDLPYLSPQGTVIVPQKNQNYTDLTKAIHFCDHSGVRDIVIVCAGGHCMDHALANLRVLKSQHRPDRPLTLHTEKETLTYIENNCFRFVGEPGERCGVLGFPRATFSSQGLKYNGNETLLSLGEGDSTSNQLLGHEAMLEVKGEALLVAPGGLSAHKRFKNLSYDAIAKMVLEEQGFI